MHAIKQIGNYKLIDKLGEGGMGTVFLGEEISSGNKAAIKVIRADVSSKDSIAARFRHEINVSKQFAHPFVIKILDGGMLPDKKSMYLAMEFLPGESLGTAMANRDISSNEAWNILSHMAEALSYIHQRGVIHRDIKPDNILLASPDRTVLLDFGLALMDDQTRLSATSDRPGTWGTMAPEQMRGQPLDGRSDVYSLGVTVFWALVKRSPYTRHDIVRIYNGTNLVPPDLSKIHDSIHPSLAGIIRKCMAFLPEDRFESASQLHSVLQKGPQAYPVGFFDQPSHPGGSMSTSSNASTSRKVSTSGNASTSRKVSTSGSVGTSRKVSTSGNASTSRKVISKALSEEGRISAVSAISKLSDSSFSRRRIIRGAGVFMSALVILLVAWLVYGRSGSDSPMTFRSSISVITPTSVSLEIGNDSRLSHIHLWEENSEDKKKVVFFNKSEFSNTTALKVEFKDLLPAQKYYYVLFGRNEESSLRKFFTTSRLIESTDVENVSATTLTINMKANYTGPSLLKIEAFQLAGGKSQKVAFCKISQSIDFVTGQVESFVLKGLKPESEYNLAVSIKTKVSDSLLTSNESLFVTTKRVYQKRLLQISGKNTKNQSLGELFPGAKLNLGGVQSATSAREVIDNKIVFSGNDIGLYLFDLKEKKVLKQVSIPGRNNLAIKIKGDKVFCLETPLAEDDKSEAGKGERGKFLVKSYLLDSLTLVNTIEVSSKASKYFLWTDGDRAIVNGGNGSGSLLCYSLSKGNLLWETTELVEGEFSLIASSGIFWVKGREQFMYGYNMETGIRKFTVPIDQYMSDGPVEVNGLIAIFLLNGDINVVDGRSGKPVGSISTGNPVKCALADESKLYCVGSAIDSQNVLGTGSQSGRLFCLDFTDRTNIKELFSLDLIHARSSRGYIHLSDGYLYYSTPMLGINCIDIVNGNFLYTHECIKASPFSVFTDLKGFFYCHVGGLLNHVSDR
jgi:serine/threonine protein kinase